MSDSRIRVAVVFGGASSEHAISCATAAGVLGAIDRDRFEVVPIGISPKGEWVLAADDPQRWALDSGGTGQPATDAAVPDGGNPGAGEASEGEASDGNPGDVRTDPGPQAPGAGAPRGPVVGAEHGLVTLPLGDGTQGPTVTAPGQVPRELAAVDVVFPLLHGPFGEDGTVQGLLELAGLPYVGSGVLASAVGMDKHYMKVVLRDAGLPVGPWLTVTPRRWAEHPDEVTAAAGELGWPVFVKPARAGSSVGVSKVEGPQGLAEAITLAQASDPKVLIEAAIAGREIECAVLGGRDGGPPRTTVPGEIVVGSDGGFYDFETKYFDPGAAELLFPADVPEVVVDQARDLAARTYEALGCEGLARVDFFYTTEGTLLVNEINTMPGFTPFSMFPMLWQRSGMTYPELITELLDLALQRPVGLR
ncbi:D-alanine--D-alanine ligase family protein [Pseudactinotalea sp. Z1732]|uniref:D-alanine--D-alanine ligase family protein n=1 Tax=Pseudactinotalea sp. Z1732 TaxID=3413026 RepID=UPI003C79745E